MLEGTGSQIDTITTDTVNTIKTIVTTGMTDDSTAPEPLSYAANAASPSTGRGGGTKTLPVDVIVAGQRDPAPPTRFKTQTNRRLVRADVTKRLTGHQVTFNMFQRNVFSFRDQCQRNEDKQHVEPRVNPKGMRVAE